MEARYRKDYVGEFVIIESKWSGGKKTENREWIPNPIENQHISGRAVCINKDPGAAHEPVKLDYRVLQRHKGGLLGSKKVQTYGVGDIATEMRLDFAVETDAVKLSQLMATDYQTNNIVYTSARNCVRYPGNFYLIPYKQIMTDMATAVYLAAFDGHKEIFLIGYNDLVDPGQKDWAQQITAIFSSYTGTLFHLVGERARMYDDWLNCANVRAMDYNHFIAYADV